MANSKRPQQNFRQSSTSTRLYVLVAIFLGLLGALLLTWYQRQNIYDWYKLRGYQAPTSVAALADQDAMTPYARKVFYVNKPALEAKTEFKQCRTNSEQSIVLGCYHGFQNGIYVLTVTDARLDGVEQVTAAHEMLHAAYDRLSTKDRAEIDKQLREYFNHQLTDERVRQTVEAYRVSEPNDITNEMHSIFGTEIANLPAPLEEYYKRYFTDRSKVTSFAAQYQAEFTSRRDAIKNYDAQLAGLKTQIQSLEADLDTRGKALDASSAELQRLRSSNDITAYNAGVPGFNASVNAYNYEVARVKSLIAQYNQLVNARNAVVLEAQTLTNEINSNVAPIRAK